jgi:NADH:ubiquinone oxidoreductase subunit 6 (chain J)
MERALFVIFAVTAIGAALNVLVRRHPLHSALALLVVLGALTGLYVLLGAYFLAVIQVVIYAGAVLVLFLFVIMLLNVRAEERGSSAVRTCGGSPFLLPRSWAWRSSLSCAFSRRTRVLRERAWV